MLGHRTLNVEDYLAIFKRRWWIVVIPTIILPIAAIALTFVIPPVYESQSLVLIDQQKVPEDFVHPIVNEDLDSRVASMNEQVLSRSSLQPIVDKYNLYGDQRMDMDARIDRVRTKDITLQAIRSQISHGDGLPGFRIFFRASDPRTAAQVCADLTSLFTKVNLNSREAAAEGTTSFIKERLEQAKRDLDDQDAKLAAFQRLHFGMLPDDEKSNLDLLSTLNAQLDAATGQLQTLDQQQVGMEALLAQQSQPVATTPTGAPVRTSQAEQAELDRLLVRRDDLTLRYSEDYPDVRAVSRQIADLQAQMAKEADAPPPAPTAPAASASNRPDSAVVQNLRAALAQIRTAIQSKRKQQESIEQQIRVYQGRVQSTPQVAEQFKELTRDYQTTVTSYQALLAQSQKADEATDLEHRQEGETFTVLDQANVPDSPTFPKLSVFAGGGLAAGLGLGLLIVALLEYRDTALRTERDVWAFTQLPTLAVIAWSANMQEAKPGILARLKRPFSRKTHKKLVADAPG
jgi:polysaccharide chain length determinant protein (PEP-CTERM system associated)